MVMGFTRFNCFDRFARSGHFAAGSAAELGYLRCFPFIDCWACSACFSCLILVVREFTVTIKMD